MVWPMFRFGHLHSQMKLVWVALESRRISSLKNPKMLKVKCMSLSAHPHADGKSGALS